MGLTVWLVLMLATFLNLGIHMAEHSEWYKITGCVFMCVAATIWFLGKAKII